MLETISFCPQAISFHLPFETYRLSRRVFNATVIKGHEHGYLSSVLHFVDAVVSKTCVSLFGR